MRDSGITFVWASGCTRRRIERFPALVHMAAWGSQKPSGPHFPWVSLCPVLKISKFYEIEENRGF